MAVCPELALLGVDTGGTFTDFVLIDAGGFRVHKVLSTPQAPQLAILQGIAELGLKAGTFRLVHGSTVATNAVLEGKGVKTVWLSNHGMADLLSIGRQARESLYDLQPEKPQPPVPARYCLEVGGRMDAQGQQFEALEDHELAALLDDIERLQPRAVAICQLFAYLNPSIEQRLQAAIQQRLGDVVMVCRSSQVLPVIGEYERGIATWLNAWVGPLMKDYLQALSRALSRALMSDEGDSSLAIMQSSGVTVGAAAAGELAVHLLLSGPAGGLKAAVWLGQLMDKSRLLTFDMGGTSTDVSLIDGDLQLTSEGRIGRYPVAVPMVDMHTIGAGGGSIAWCDAGGSLQVGPESAGALPGPACYGRGGTRATVSDANLVLGRLLAEDFLGGEMQLDIEAAQTAIAGLASALGLTAQQAAEGVLSIANEHMVAALRVISVQRGMDPRDFSLMSFGGAGGLHVCALADALGMSEAIVPVQAGVLSALGMLTAARGRQYARAVQGRLREMESWQIEEAVKELTNQGRTALLDDGVPNASIESAAYVDLRYEGQSYTLEVAWQDCEASAKAFEQDHERLYGHALGVAVELVGVRVSVHGAAMQPHLPSLATGDAMNPQRYTQVVGIDAPVPVYRREQLVCGQRISGPALITETVSTTWIDCVWNAQIDEFGNLILTTVASRLN